MKRFLMLIGLMAMAGCVMVERKGASALRAPEKLTAEYLVDPVGLDCAAPRLSWKLVAAKSEARNLRQVAYQVLVASSPEKLNKDSGDLWNSGRVASSQSLNVRYKGSALKTSQRCYWKVRVWAQGDDAPSAWSAPASWVMGVSASTQTEFDLRGAKWIWAGDAESLEASEPGTRYFRTFFDAPENPDGLFVTLAVIGDEDCEVWMNGRKILVAQGDFDAPRGMRFAEVSQHIRQGQNVISARVTSAKPGPTGLLAVLRFPDGSSVVTDERWNVWVGSDRPSDWGKPLSESTAVSWRGLARVAAEADAEPWGTIKRRVGMVSSAFEKAKPFKSAGTFVCSSDLINELQEAELGAYREKSGWTGDEHSHFATELAMYNFQNTAAYEKWINDLMGEQSENGYLPGTWGDVLVSVPWTLYVYQGNIQILENTYPAMAKYVDYMTSRAKDGILSRGQGDRLSANTYTPCEVTDTSYYYLGAQIVARTAELLGKAEDARKYGALAHEIREAFNREFYKGAGIYSTGSQTAQSYALHLGLVSPEERPAAQAKLIDVVKANNAYPDFGRVGIRHMLRMLSDAGRTDLAFEMATTLWKIWDEDTSDPYAILGDTSAWLYQYLGGIRLSDNVSVVAQATNPNEVAFKSFLIAPEPVKGLDWVKAEYESPYGTIRSTWVKGGGLFCLEIEVPVNTIATVCLPVEPGTNGLIADIEPTLPINNRMTFRVGSGTYTFAVPIENF